MAWQELFSVNERIEYAGDLRQWYQRLWQRLNTHEPYALAVMGGSYAPTPGLAFLAGYQAALRALVPNTPIALGALCITENRSLRPADFRAHFDNGLLTGQKDFVLGGAQSEYLLVAARNVQDQSIVLVQVDANDAQFTPIPSLNVMPDVEHTRVRFDQIKACALPGDGWDQYAKPFRTYEDTFVLAALLAWHERLLRERQGPQSLYLQVITLLGTLAHLATLNPKEPATHLLLAGVQTQYRALANGLTEALAGSAYHAMWLRDQSVLNVARKAQEARLNKALQTLHIAT